MAAQETVRARHAADDELRAKLRKSTEQLDEMAAVLDTVDQHVAAIGNMMAAAKEELGRLCDSGAEGEALRDVLSHGQQACRDSATIVRALTQRLEATRRTCATAVFWHHTSVLPHLSPEEAEIVRAMNPLVPTD